MHTSRIHSSVCQMFGKMNIRELCGHVTGTPMGCTGASNPRKLLTWDTPNGNTLSLHVHLPLSAISDDKSMEVTRKQRVISNNVYQHNCSSARPKINLSN